MRCSNRKVPGLLFCDSLRRFSSPHNARGFKSSDLRHGARIDIAKGAFKVVAVDLRFHNPVAVRRLRVKVYPYDSVAARSLKFTGAVYIFVLEDLREPSRGEIPVAIKSIIGEWPYCQRSMHCFETITIVAVGFVYARWTRPGMNRRATTTERHRAPCHYRYCQDAFNSVHHKPAGLDATVMIELYNARSLSLASTVRGETAIGQRLAKLHLLCGSCLSAAGDGILSHDISIDSTRGPFALSHSLIAGPASFA